MFLTIYYYNYRNAEFLELMNSIDQIIIESNIETLVPLHGNFKKKLGSLETVFKASLKNPLTDPINKEDNSRDNAHVGFVKVIEGYTLFSDIEKANAAKRILATIHNHGSDIVNLNLREETAVLKSLINEFENTPALSEALVLLNVEDWVSDIKTYNLNCETLLIERAEIKTAMREVNTKDLKLKIMAIFKKMAKLIEAHITLESEGGYETLKNKINDQIRDFNDTLNLRR
ncbi:MAG: DUF6261 family protein [Polaribacter sp.]